ncbi:MAG: hypothetical protein WB816_05155 [Methylocystis sp.]
MTQRYIKAIMAAVALSAPMMVSGFAQAGAYGQHHLFPPSQSFAYGITNVACQWVMDENGKLHCWGSSGEQRHVNPHR